MTSVNDILEDVFSTLHDSVDHNRKTVSSFEDRKRVLILNALEKKNIRHSTHMSTNALVRLYERYKDREFVKNRIRIKRMGGRTFITPTNSPHLRELKKIENKEANKE